MALDRVQRTDRENIRIVMADADRHLRNALRQAFSYAGFKTIHEAGSVEALHKALDETQPDLLLIAAKLPDGDGCSLVRSLRHSRVGRNPFLGIIVTAWPEEVQDVGRIVNSGTDHVVLKPVAPAAVFERIEAMIERRRPFVATATYLGPDRRGGNRPDGGEAIPLFEVPNTLRMRAMGRDVDTNNLQRAIDVSLTRINGEMVRRQAFHVVFLIERAAPLLQGGDPEALSMVAEIALCSRELARRLEPRSHGHAIELCGTLDQHLAASIGRASNHRWEAADIEVAKKLTQAIYVGLNPHPDLSDLAHKVTSAVETFQKRQSQRRQAATQEAAAG